MVVVLVVVVIVFELVEVSALVEDQRLTEFLDNHRRYKCDTKVAEYT